MAQAIAAAASLALAVKLKKIFEKPDKFLTFPTGLGFSYEYLDFMGDPFESTLSAQEQLNFKADFARQMNLIPEDKPAYVPDASQFLWDEVETILNDSVFAKSALTPQEERQLAEAMDFLTDEQTDEDDTAIPVNSPQVTEYYKYKTLCEEAQRTYLDEKLSIEFDTGPDAEQLKEKWDAYREKQLKDAWDKSMQEWIDLGFKRQVEQAQALKNNLELRKYLDLYRQQYLEELSISEIPDLNGNGIGFFTSFFSPADAFDKNLPWTQVTLTKSEIAGLINEAPPALKTYYGTDDANLDIESLTLEYNNVIVMRPWFKAEFFHSRYWRLPDDRVVSNGKVPNAGQLPAYITSMIVARNVEIRRRKEAAKKPLVLPMISKLPIQKIQLAKKAVAAARPVRRRTTATAARAPQARVVAARRVTTAVRRSSFPRIRVRRTGSQPSTTRVRDHRTATRVSATRVRDHQTAARVRDHRSTTRVRDHRTGTNDTTRFYAHVKFNGTTIRTSTSRRLITVPIRRADVRIPPSNSQIVTEKVNFDGVSVLALVCKRLPKSPDPDEALTW
jgi:hypothetical protein